KPGENARGHGRPATVRPVITQIFRQNPQRRPQKPTAPTILPAQITEAHAKSRSLVRKNRVVYPLSVVRENDAAGSVAGLADGARIDERAVQTPRARPKICTLHPLHVIPCFPEPRNTMSPVDGSLASIVRRQGQFQIAIVPFKQRLQISNTGVDILL